MSYDLVARIYFKSFIESLWKTDTFNQGEKTPPNRNVVNTNKKTLKM